jgi:hypothetical protein
LGEEDDEEIAESAKSPYNELPELQPTSRGDITKKPDSPLPHRLPQKPTILKRFPCHLHYAVEGTWRNDRFAQC